MITGSIIGRMKPAGSIVSILNEKIGYPIRYGVRQPVRASQKRRPSPLRRSDTSQTSAVHDILYAELDGNWFAFLGQLGPFSADGSVSGGPRGWVAALAAI